MTNAQTYDFLKMHGLGNDFIIFDARHGELDLSSVQVQALSNRHRGVGCDQLAILRPSNKADVYMEIRNHDGSMVGACGNMSRCVGRLLLDETGQDCVHIETSSTILTAYDSDGLVSVNMGPARLNWQDIPLTHQEDTLCINMVVGPLSSPVCVNMGNPHVVFIVDDVQTVDLAKWGPVVETHEIFPKHANVSIISISGDRIRQRVWERGTGITQACGSGACAALVAAARLSKTGRSATVELDGGPLQITWLEDDTVEMAGPATLVYKGSVVI